MLRRVGSPGPHRVDLVGEIDLANAEAHGDLLCRLLDLRAGDTLVVDCANLAFLELRGMAMMRRVHRHGIALGTEVHWVGLAAAHHRLLVLAGLDQLLLLDRWPPCGTDDDAADAHDSASDSASCSSESQNRKKPSWSSPIWWK